jgi:cysteinyl-tRNA synthetase
LGKYFDIHGGGLDLVFPHHENEIAQSCCSNKNDKFANYWIHNGFVTFDKEKMSKSIGNIVTIKSLSEKINGQVVRLALLSSHYKQPLDWNEKLIDESKNTLNKWYNQFEQIDTSELDEDIILPLLEDLNTPEYISKLHYLYEESSKGNNLAKVRFLKACNFIGLLEEDKKSWENFKKSKVTIDENFINKKIKDRNNARNNGDYKLADSIRKELEIEGIIIEDKQEQTRWKYK